MLNEDGCRERERQLTEDFGSGRLSEYIFECNEHVVGMISFGKTGEADCPNAPEVWRLYVDRKIHGKGMGKSLLEFAEEEARSGGYPEIVILAFKRNINAVEFYEKHGYFAGRDEFLGAPCNAEGFRLKKSL